MKLSDITFENSRGHLLQRLDGTFARGETLSLYMNWRQNISHHLGDTDVEIVKESKLQPFKILLCTTQKQRLTLLG